MYSNRIVRVKYRREFTDGTSQSVVWFHLLQHPWHCVWAANNNNGHIKTDSVLSLFLEQLTRNYR